MSDAARDPNQRGPGTTEVAVRRDGAHVVFAFPNPIMWAKLDWVTAYNLAEATARAAHEAQHGAPPNVAGSYMVELEKMVRQQVTEELRDRMVTRATIVVQNLVERKVTPGRAALEIVDTVLAMAQGKVV